MVKVLVNNFWKIQLSKNWLKVIKTYQKLCKNCELSLIINIHLFSKSFAKFFVSLQELFKELFSFNFFCYNVSQCFEPALYTYGLRDIIEVHPRLPIGQ